MNTIPPIGTYFFKIDSNIFFSSTPRPPRKSVKILKALLPSVILTTWYANLNLLDLITLNLIGELYRVWSSSLWSLLHSPFSALLGPNICLRILFLNTLSLHCCSNVKYYVSKPYNTNDNIIVLYILIFKFLERSRKDKSIWTE